MTTYNKRRVIILSIVTFLLMIPLIAMRLTTEVDWSALDFVIAGTLFSGTGLACELALRKIRNRSTRIGITIAMVIVAFLIRAELAVGIFGSPVAGN